MKRRPISPRLEKQKKYTRQKHGKRARKNIRNGDNTDPRFGRPSKCTVIDEVKREKFAKKDRCPGRIKQRRKGVVTKKWGGSTTSIGI